MCQKTNYIHNLTHSHIHAHRIDNAISFQRERSQTLYWMRRRRRRQHMNFRCRDFRPQFVPTIFLSSLSHFEFFAGSIERERVVKQKLPLIRNSFLYTQTRHVFHRLNLWRRRSLQHVSIINYYMLRYGTLTLPEFQNCVLEHFKSFLLIVSIMKNFDYINRFLCFLTPK